MTVPLVRTTAVTVVVSELSRTTTLQRRRIRRVTFGLCADWPSLTSGEKRITVVVDGNRSDSYAFDVAEGGDGPNLTIAIRENEIDFSLEPNGM